MTLALELPEILYRIGLYLDADQVLACSLVCRTFYNAYSPLVWKDLHFSLTKQQLKAIREKTPLARKISFRHLFESNELERGTEELISILQDRAPWMRSLTIHQHDSVQQFSSFGPRCNRVEALSIEGIPLCGDYEDKTYWKSCKALLRQNRPDLRSLSLQNWKPEWRKPLPGQPVWNPILSCTQHLNLTSLSLISCKIRGKHLRAFWTISARLESLVMEDVDMDLTWTPTAFYDKGKGQDDGKDKDELEVRFFRRHHPLTQLYWLIIPCPALQKLTWLFDWHRHFPTQPFMDAFEDSPTSPTAWPDLDSITIKGHSNWITEENHFQLLKSARHPLRRLDLVHGAMQPKSFEMLQTRHFATIQTIDLTYSVTDHSCRWVIVILESCNSLERIKSKVVKGQDIIKSKPWACQGLKSWIMAIDMDFDNPDAITTTPAGTGTGTVDTATNTSSSSSSSGSGTAPETGAASSSSTPPDTSQTPTPLPPTTNGPNRRLLRQERQACRAVYRRFSTLTQLCEFDMLHSHNMNYLTVPGSPQPSNPNHPNHRLISLPLRLACGLDLLSRLVRLEKFSFWSGYTHVREREIEWILGHWKDLKKLAGGFSIPGRMIQTVYKDFAWSNQFTPMLKEHGITTDGSRYQHYDDSAEILAEGEQGLELEDENDDDREEEEDWRTVLCQGGEVNVDDDSDSDQEGEREP
ncbi:hypothetical protein BGX29_008569 [Mortierella sp. GBA35]|nr:hypothetical protein BGX29_008569 [Mortierella sp. GBA35]